MIKYLHAEQSLTGSTIEAHRVNSLVELRFRNSSILSKSEGSVLTIADKGKKVLHLRSGVLSAEVEKQPTIRPMILTTSTARIEILGSQFDLQIPIREFQSRRKRNGESSTNGMEVSAWFCFTSEPNAELTISHVELVQSTESR